jgi:hypothetical protein
MEGTKRLYVLICKGKRERGFETTRTSELPMAFGGNDEDISYSLVLMGCFSGTGNDPTNCYQVHSHHLGSTSEVLQVEAQLNRISGRASSRISGYPFVAANYQSRYSFGRWRSTVEETFHPNQATDMDKENLVGASAQVVSRARGHITNNRHNFLFAQSC